MPSFLFAFAAVLLTSVGNRDQLLVAELADTSRRAAAVLVAAIVASFLSAGLMAWAGATIAGIMPGNGKVMLIAFALGAAALELAWPVKQPKPMKEPTRSVGAMFIVLLARQLGDAPRFLVFALAAGTASPILAGGGGAVGGALAATISWTIGAQEMRTWPLRAIRVVLAVLVAIAGAYAALNARAIIG